MKLSRTIKRVLKPVMGSPVTSVLLEILLIIPFFVLAWRARYRKKPFDIGIGPQPIINNVYHKKALLLYGYRTETYVLKSSFITSEFDFDMSKVKFEAFPLPPIWRWLALFTRALRNYRALFFYFNGGPLFPTKILRWFEPYYYKVAGMKLILLPYGSDVQDMRLSPNLHFKEAMALDYPNHRHSYNRIKANLTRWTRYADWIISGMEWVDYMGHWNNLMSNHFAIDLDLWKPVQTIEPRPDDSLRILHAPNHRNIKGTGALEKAVEKLRAEGLALELVILEKVPNNQIRNVMASVDIVAEQFIVGWYSMFAMEGMALEKPVMTYLRPDLMELYTKVGIFEPGEIPILNTGVLEIESTLRWVYENREMLPLIGKRSRAFVERHHSLVYIGSVFNDILQKIGLEPSGEATMITLNKADPDISASERLVSGGQDESPVECCI